VDDFRRRWLVAAAGRATSEVAAQLRQILWHDWAIAGLIRGTETREPVRALEREQNRPSLRALETPPTANDLGHYSLKRIGGDEVQINHIPCTDRQSRLPPITQGNPIENH